MSPINIKPWSDILVPAKLNDNFSKSIFLIDPLISSINLSLIYVLLFMDEFVWLFYNTFQISILISLVVSIIQYSSKIEHNLLIDDSLKNPVSNFIITDCLLQTTL